MPRAPYQTVMDIGDRLAVGEATGRGRIEYGTLRVIAIGRGSRIAERGFAVLRDTRAARARDRGARGSVAIRDPGPVSLRDG